MEVEVVNFKWSRTWKIAALVATLLCVVLMLQLNEDQLFTSTGLFVLLLISLAGLALSAPARTRPVGAGLMLGAAGSVILFLLFFGMVVLRLPVGD